MRRFRAVQQTTSVTAGLKCAPGIGPSCYQDNDDRARRYGVAEKRDCHFVGEPISHDAGADDGADEDGGAPGFGGEAAFEIERPASACLGRVQSLLQRELVGAGHRQAGEDQDAVCLGKRKMPLGLAAAGGGWIRYRGDGKSYTIKLRTGIKFHDNSDMTSEDVVASLTRWTKIASRGKQAAGFRLQASGFRLQASGFRLHRSDRCSRSGNRQDHPETALCAADLSACLTPQCALIGCPGQTGQRHRERQHAYPPLTPRRDVASSHGTIGLC